MIPPIQEERLSQIGQWLSYNGESIFNSTPWSTCQFEPKNYRGLWYTRNAESSFPVIIIYPIILVWPEDSKLYSVCLDKLNVLSIVMLDTGSMLKWSQTKNEGLVIELDDYWKMKTQWGWALRVAINMA